MPLFIEFFVITFAMMGGFFLVFLLMFLLAVSLLPIEQSLSKIIWDMQEAKQKSRKSSFREFSRKH